MKTNEDVTMTPNDIEILIHCYVSPKCHPRYDAPAVKDSIAMLSKMGLIEHTGLNIFNATARGVAHIQQLCNIGLPVQKWVGADGKEIQA